MIHTRLFNGRRIALVTNIPRPYRIPLFEALNQTLLDSGSDLKIFFFSDIKKHVRRREIEVANGRYPHQSVYGYELSFGFERVISIPTPLWSALHQYQPHAIISGSFGLAGYLSWLYSRRASIPYIQWSGATSNRQGQGGDIVGITQGFLARRAQSSLAYGTVARDYLIQLGADPQTVIAGVNTIDVAYFRQRAAQLQAEANSLKAEHNLTGVNLLYVGNLVSLKGIEYLLQALHQIAPTTNSFHLHLVGGGPDKASLEALVQSLQLECSVHFWGAHPPENVPLFYALADVLVFPSLYDVWGLVVNEAMACGLPIISSSLAGVTADLVQPEQNGFVVDPRDVPGFAAALGRVISDEALRQRMGYASTRLIDEKATIPHAVAAFLQALQIALT